MIVRQQIVKSTQNISLNPNDRKTVTVHETGNTARGANAAAHANLQSRPNPRLASWHWQVDDKEAVQSFLHGVRTFHAGTALGNREGISVEICVNSDGNQMQAYRNAAELVASILVQENLPLTAVVQHNYYSGKNCPEKLRAGTPLSWGSFLALVKSHLPTAGIGGKPDTNTDTNSAEGFLMALSDAQQAAVYDALVNQKGGYYYKTDAIINILRDELKPILTLIQQGHIRFPGADYNAFPAVINAIREEGDPAPAISAAELARELAPLIASNVGSLSDADVARIAKAATDEQAKRLGGK